MGRHTTRIEREKLLREMNDAWAAWTADPDLRREAEDEDAIGDATLLDRLDDEEWLQSDT